ETLPPPSLTSLNLFLKSPRFARRWLEDDGPDRGGSVAELVLVLGGVRSGKSRLAESLAAAAPPVTYVATATALDSEMTERIARHRQRRPVAWQTVEEPWDIAAVLARHQAGCLLLECLNLWITNLLVGVADRPALDDSATRAMVSELVKAVGGA